MAAFKTQKIVFGALLIAIMGSSSAALAGNIDLINSALNSSLEEKADVTAEYKSNAAAERPDNHFEERVNSPRIELTINGELNGGGSDRLKDYDSPNRVYREKRIQAKLDKEVEAVDREYAKNVAPKKPTGKDDKAVGFQYSEAKLPQ
jgi:hypothetical protein